MCNNNELNKDKIIIQQSTEKIRTKLNAVFNNKEYYQKTWIWELIQNAVDNVTKINNVNELNNNVDIEINVNETSLTFKHNNGYFTIDQLLNIILQKHGDIDDNNQPINIVGRFGSGFITTYILSTEVTLKGSLNINNHFRNFEIDISRNINNLNQSITDSYKQFNEIINNNNLDNNNNNNNIDTVFTYKNVNNDTFNLIKNSFDNLRKTILLSKRFTPCIREIKINNEPIDINENILIFEGNYNNNYYTIAIVCADNEITNIIEQDIPNIFINYPLIKSNILKLPFVIHSLHFEPNEERSMIFLGTSGDASEKNKEMLRNVFIRYIEILGNQDIRKKDKLYNLCRIIPINDDIIGDKDFINNQLKILVQGIINIPIIRTVNNTYCSLINVQIPFDNDKAKRVKMYNLLSQLNGFNLPLEKDIDGWNEILNTPFYKETLRNNTTIFSIDKLINFLENVEHNENLIHINDLMETFTNQDNINDEIWNWLNNFYSLFDTPGYLNNNIYINESGYFIPFNRVINRTNYPLQIYHGIDITFRSIITDYETLRNIVDFRRVTLNSRINNANNVFISKCINIFFKDIANVLDNYIRDNIQYKFNDLRNIINNLLTHIILNENYIIPNRYSNVINIEIGFEQNSIKKACFPYCYENKDTLSLRLMGNNNASLLLNFVTNVPDENIRHRILNFTEIEATQAIEFINNIIYEDDSNLIEEVPANPINQNENQNYMQINHQLLNQEFFIPTWDCDTLILGTFNPAGGRPVNYFYGRNSNNFWKAISRLYGFNEDHFHNLMRTNFEAFNQFMIQERFGCVDIIRSIVINEEFTESIIGNGYSDQNLFNMKYVARNYNFEEIEKYIMDNKRVSYVINTVGQRFDNIRPNELKMQLKKFSDFCLANDVHYIENCPSVSGRLRGEDNLNNIIEFYRTFLIPPIL